MKHLFLLLVMAAVLSACAPSFEISTNQDKFTDPEAPLIISSSGNKLTSKAIGGGLLVDEKGFYLDPYIAVDRETDKIIDAGFYVNYLNYTPVNGFNPITSIIFIAGDNRFEVPVKNKGWDYNLGKWNSVAKDYMSTYSEGGIASVKLGNFLTLFKNPAFEAKVIGGKANLVINNNDKLTSFNRNMFAFYQRIIGYLK